MKKYITAFIVVVSLHLADSSRLPAQTVPGVGNITGLISRAIKAIDLKIQRLQNKTIALQNAQKLVENAMSKLHLQDLAAWAERQKSLYEKYFQELGQVKLVLTRYWKVKDIIERQVQLVREYQQGWRLFKSDAHFSGAELEQIYRIYSGILKESLSNLDQLTIACSALGVQMSDGKRMQLIESAGKLIEQNLADLRSFNNSTALLSLGRAVDLADAAVIKKMYGIQ